MPPKYGDSEEEESDGDFEDGRADHVGQLAQEPILGFIQGVRCDRVIVERTLSAFEIDSGVRSGTWRPVPYLTPPRANAQYNVKTASINQPASSPYSSHRTPIQRPASRRGRGGGIYQRKYHNPII